LVSQREQPVKAAPELRIARPDDRFAAGDPYGVRRAVRPPRSP